MPYLGRPLDCLASLGRSATVKGRGGEIRSEAVQVLSRADVDAAARHSRIDRCDGVITARPIQT
jgi:hypothetical protein